MWLNLLKKLEDMDRSFSSHFTGLAIVFFLLKSAERGVCDCEQRGPVQYEKGSEFYFKSSAIAGAFIRLLID